MFIIKGIGAEVTSYNRTTGDWSGDEFTKDNPYSDQLTVLTKESLTVSLSDMLNIDIDFKHIYTQDDILTVSIIEDADGYPDENGLYLVDYVFVVSMISNINIHDVLKEGVN